MNNNINVFLNKSTDKIQYDSDLKFDESRFWKGLKFFGKFLCIALLIFTVVRVFMLVVIGAKITADGIRVYDYEYELNEQDLAAINSKDSSENDTYGYYYKVMYDFNIRDYGVKDYCVEGDPELINMTPEFEKMIMSYGIINPSDIDGHDYGSEEGGEEFKESFWDAFSNFFWNKLVNIERDYDATVILHINSLEYSKEELEDILKNVKFKATLKNGKKITDISFDSVDNVETFLIEDTPNAAYDWRANEWIFYTEHGKVERAKREGLPENSYQ